MPWKRISTSLTDARDRKRRRGAAASFMLPLRGMLLAMPGPSAAIRSADAMRRTCSAATCRMRAGVHVGECDRGSIDLDGELMATVKQLAVQAAADQILVPQAVRAIVSGRKIVLNQHISKQQEGGAIGEAICTASIAGCA